MFTAVVLPMWLAFSVDRVIISGFGFGPEFLVITVSLAWLSTSTTIFYPITPYLWKLVWASGFRSTCKPRIGRAKDHA